MDQVRVLNDWHSTSYAFSAHKPGVCTSLQQQHLHPKYNKLIHLVSNLKENGRLGVIFYMEA